MTTRPYDDIPGTYVFDGRRSRQGYALNTMLGSLNDPVEREALATDAAGWLDRWPITPAQRDAVERRDWLAMLHLGGNIYYMYKLAAFDGLSMQDIGASMSGVTTEEFSDMMIAGGRSIDGNRFAGHHRDDTSPGSAHEGH